MMSVSFSIVFILAIHFLRKRSFFLQTFGVHTILLLYSLCFFRMIFAFEMPFVIPIGVRGVFSATYAKARDAQIPIGHLRISFFSLLRSIWLIAAGCLLLQFIIGTFWTNCKLAPFRKNRAVSAESILKKVTKESRMKISVDVYICPEICVPMGAGIIQKRIYLPDEEYTKKELYYILKHEYAHFCNRDLIIKFLVKLFCCIFWWNPAIYLLKKDIAQILEVKCDVSATQNFSKREKMEYLLTIIRILKSDTSEKCIPPLFLTTRMFSEKCHNDIKERFEFITRIEIAVPTWWRTVTWIVAIITLMGSYFIVLQPAFDPKSEDIYTNSSVIDLNPESVYILSHRDGTYSLMLENGEICSISEPFVQMYKELGTKIRKE